MITLHIKRIFRIMQIKKLISSIFLLFFSFYAFLNPCDLQENKIKDLKEKTTSFFDRLSFLEKNFQEKSKALHNYINTKLKEINPSVTFKQWLGESPYLLNKPFGEIFINKKINLVQIKKDDFNEFFQIQNSSDPTSDPTDEKNKKIILISPINPRQKHGAPDIIGFSSPLKQIFFRSLYSFLPGTIKIAEESVKSFLTCGVFMPPKIILESFCSLSVGIREKIFRPTTHWLIEKYIKNSDQFPLLIKKRAGGVATWLKEFLPGKVPSATGNIVMFFCAASVIDMVLICGGKESIFDYAKKTPPLHFFLSSLQQIPTVFLIPPFQSTQFAFIFSFLQKQGGKIKSSLRYITNQKDSLLEKIKNRILNLRTNNEKIAPFSSGKMSKQFLIIGNDIQASALRILHSLISPMPSFVAPNISLAYDYPLIYFCSSSGWSILTKSIQLPCMVGKFYFKGFKKIAKNLTIKRSLGIIGAWNLFFGITSYVTTWAANK